MILKVKISYGTLSVKPYWPEKGHGIKGQDQLWHFVRETLLARNRLDIMRRPEWFAGAFTICNWIVRPSFCSFIYPFVRYFLTLTY